MVPSDSVTSDPLYSASVLACLASLGVSSLISIETIRHAEPFAEGSIFSVVGSV